MTSSGEKKPFIFSFFSSCIFWLATAGFLFLYPLQKAIKNEKKYTEIKIILGDIPFDFPITTMPIASESEIDTQNQPNQENFLDALQKAHPTLHNQDEKNLSSQEIEPQKEFIEQKPLVAKSPVITKNPPKTSQPPAKSVLPPVQTETKKPLTSDSTANTPKTEEIFTKIKTEQQAQTVEQIEYKTDENTNNSQQEEQKPTQIVGVAITTSEGNQNPSQTELSQTDHLQTIFSFQPTQKLYSANSNNLNYQIKGFFVEQNTNTPLLRMNDGTMRKLLVPSEPKLILSDESEITQTINTTIRFRILATGMISASNLQIESDSPLSPQIHTEIRSTLLQWQFDAASTFTQGSFQYRIAN
ncbi:MAG: hypothetical protein ACRC5H_00250 [Treponemataceae bacterium]